MCEGILLRVCFAFPWWLMELSTFSWISPEFPPFGELPVQVSCLFFYWIFVPFLIWRRSLYFLGTSHLSGVCAENIFSQSVTCLFKALLIMSFCTEILNFNVEFSVFSFVSILMSFKNFLLTPSACTYVLMTQKICHIHLRIRSKYTLKRLSSLSYLVSLPFP